MKTLKLLHSYKRRWWYTLSGQERYVIETNRFWEDRDLDVIYVERQRHECIGVDPCNLTRKWNMNVFWYVPRNINTFKKWLENRGDTFRLDDHPYYPKDVDSYPSLKQARQAVIHSHTRHNTRGYQ